VATKHPSGENFSGRKGLHSDLSVEEARVAYVLLESKELLYGAGNGSLASYTPLTEALNERFPGRETPVTDEIFRSFARHVARHNLKKEDFSCDPEAEQNGLKEVLQETNLSSPGSFFEDIERDLRTVRKYGPSYETLRPREKAALLGARIRLLRPYLRQRGEDIEEARGEDVRKDLANTQATLANLIN
jgi:hypothetical protein